MEKKYWYFIVIIAAIALLVWFVNDRTGVFEQPVERGQVVDLEGRDTDKAPLGPQRYAVEEFVSGLVVPWDMAFTSADRVLVTERPGRVRVIEGGQLQLEPLHVFSDVVSGGEEGLMSVALHPEYGRNQYVYFSYAFERGADKFVRVVRFKDGGSRLTDELIIIDNIPAATFHAGSRVRFGPDNKLYITTGDATDRQLAQNLNSLAGKILRLNDDGSIPDDNPFADSPVLSYGHRNPQGITWHPDTKEMYQTEHGPSGFDGPGGGDEVNRIIKGTNYGWPLVSHERSHPEAKDPLLVFTPAEAPGSALIYSGDRLPVWRGDLFFGALRGQGVMRLEIDENNPDQIVRFEKLNQVSFGRIRTVMEGPDGYIYFMTSNRDGRGQPASIDDRIFRIIPID